jgi:sulfoxide reductase heme-binding subunit YedZ
MIALTSPYFWYTTRATGFVALILFTIVVALGTFVANRIGGTMVGRFELNELHRSVSIIAVVFLVIHITSTVVDSFVPTGWVSAIVPMTSAYKRVPVALGAVAFDLILAVWISSLLKVRIANQTWRFIHWFSWLALASALVHTILAGTDSRKGFGVIVAAASASLVLASGIWRYLGRPTRAAGRTALSPLAVAKDQSSPARAPRDSPPTVRPMVTRPAQPAPPRAADAGFQRGPRAPSKKRKSR